jgi:NAD(P)H-hydrate epimerase
LTISIALPKSGFILGKGPEYCGCLRCVDIGIPQEFIEPVKSDLCMVFEKDMREFLGRVSVLSHKNTRGRLLVIGGSLLYPGAPFLAAEAALRAGAGLVFLAVPASIAEGINRSRALVLRGVADKGSGFFGLESLPELEMLADSVDAVVIGPGMSTEKCVYPIIEHFCELDKPVLFDADALNMISKYPESLMPGINSVLTPHPGEMARLLSGAELTGLISSDRITQARQLASKIGSTILLKGNRSITASSEGDVCVNCTGNPALSTAGSGDVLSGVIGAFLSQGCDPMLATTAGVYLHGYAGEISEFGVRGTIADDLLYLIPQAMKDISPFA